jgi:SAM-dependent methyltransferase
MTNQHDIFGLAFHDYLNGEKEEKILVDINISETEEQLPVSYFFRDFRQMPLWEKKVLKECRGSILDVGAGAGSHALYLQKKGLDVTAIDISPGGVECMNKRGIRKAFVQDFFTYMDEKFDTILLLMNGTGMAGTISNLPNLLTHAASLLNPGGNIYLESTDILYMFEDEDVSAMIDLAGKYYGEITYKLQYKDFIGEPFPWLFVDFDNLSQAAEQAGLHCECFFAGKTNNYIAQLSLAETR